MVYRSENPEKRGSLGVRKSCGLAGFLGFPEHQQRKKRKKGERKEKRERFVGYQVLEDSFMVEKQNSKRKKGKERR